ncbi:uncharacterized protein LOC107363327 [Tetranychus urticae]|uniref:uncharacterized protein LOC107363327 n=1 Tax=Tetranychus urticae TaxID=32264 RepID=UPI00077BFD71|nr:uncharacterized protein LOC107363327 [Tetranychus urticae]
MRLSNCATTVMMVVIVFVQEKSTSKQDIESLIYPTVNPKDNQSSDNRSDIDYDSDSNDEPVKKQINTGLGLLPRRRNSLCVSEFLFCASSFSCLDVICTDKLIEEIDSCQYGTIYCPETDECLVNCPSTSPESIPTTDGTINFFDLNGTDVIDNIPADNLPEDEFYANSTDLVVTIPIVLTFKDDYETAVVNRSRLFIQSIKRQLVKNLNLPESSIQNLVILKNPFKISFDLVYWPEQDDFSNITLSSFRETVSKFQEKLLTTGIDFTGLDNETIVAIKDDNKKVPDVQQPPTTVQGNQKTETSSTSSPEKSNASEFSDGRNNLAIILGLVAGAVLLILIVIIGIIYRKRTIYNRRRKIAPFSRMSTRKNLASSAITFRGSQRILTGNRDDILSEADYDDHVSWLKNRTNEPSDEYITPDPAIYVPPAEEEIKRTPRPSTRIIRHE